MSVGKPSFLGAASGTAIGAGPVSACSLPYASRTRMLGDFCRIRSRMEGGVGGGSMEDSGGTEDVDPSPFCSAAILHGAPLDSLAGTLDSPLESAEGLSKVPSDAVSDSTSKRTFNAAFLLADVSGAGVLTQPPGGAGVLGGREFARESVEGGVASPLSDDGDFCSAGGAEPARSTCSRVDCRDGAGVASQAPGGRGVLSAVRSPWISLLCMIGV